ncbi:hypothetical protein BDW02DRAFT_504237 [Decorospora gaudefroyi]|uniref:Uncharacterized protein n=1 Tax=Decorospora gaudefroyi TaxID=184978 RepID=A0A6A5K4M2_9PLEO|nr:hypothetical protein BDW02DRAFT_504237 [Decorospora gaudefroyi]
MTSRPANTKPNTKGSSKSQLEDFLCRANNAGLHVSEPGNGGQDKWELVDEKSVLEEQDKEEWTIVGKTGAEKREQEKRE